MFYTFGQNNSGGSFVQDENISHYVIIEASSAAEADKLAESKGLYFDGEGDCPCCGNRWSNAWYDEGDDVPSIYEKPVTEYRASYGFMSEYETVVHYLSGKIEYYTSDGVLVDRKLENLG